MYRIASILVATSILVSTAPASAQDTDRVVFLSDRFVVGTLQSLTRGQVAITTPELGSVQASWDDVASVTASGTFEVVRVSGRVHFGRLAPGSAPRRLTVVGRGGTFEIPFDEVVAIESIAQSFLQRTSGFLDVGLDVVRANDLVSLLVKSRAQYNGRRWFLSLDGERYAQRQEVTDTLGQTSQEQATRTALNLTGKRFIGGKFAFTAGQRYEQNDELSLERRLLTTAGAEYNLIRNQSMELRFGVAGVLNSEAYLDERQVETGEVNVNAGFDAFGIGAFSLYTGVNTYTNPRNGRLRMDIDGRLSWNLFGNFTLGLNVIEKYDSAPPDGAVGRDYQYGASVGWSWG